jgi:amino acid adenylation domain-containing protein
MLGNNAEKSVIQGYRLSPQQECLWLLERNAQALPGTDCVVRIEGRLDPVLLKTAIHSVIQRHEVLRTTFSQLPGMTFPVQVIAETDHVTEYTYDLTPFSDYEQEAKVQALRFTTGSSSIDSKDDSATNYTLVRLGPATHVLLVRVPRCCADAMTLHNFVHQVCRAYTAAFRGESVSEDDVLQYADFAEWQHAVLEEDIDGVGHTYWRKRMQSMSGLFESRLPFELVAIDHPMFIAKHLPVTISQKLVERIDRVALSYEVDTSTFLLACWFIVLQRLTGQENVLVGVGSGGRTHEDMMEALGPFARYLPVACRLETHRLFRGILEPLQQSLREAEEWQDYYSWKVAQESDGPSLEKFFSFCFEFHNPPLECHGSDLLFVIEHRNAYIDQFKVRFVCERKGNSIDAVLHYNAALYEDATVACLAEQLATLMEHAAHQPDTAIGDLEMLSETQRRQVLRFFNDSGVLPPQDRCLHELFERQVDRAPGNIAVVYEEHTLTYQELNLRADRLAGLLISQGVRSETPVGVCMERSLELIIGLLAILKAGGAYVPIDPFYPKDRIHYILEDSQALLLLTQQKFQDEFSGTTAAILILDEDRGISDETIGPITPIPRNPDTVAYIIYTSGSTGRPKGVLVNHRNAVYSTLTRLSYYTDRVSTFLLLSSFAFDSSVAGIFWTLSQGGRLCFIREGSQKDPSELGKVIERLHVSHLLCLPSLFSLLLEQVPHHHLRSLRTVIVAGEICPRELVVRHHAHLAPTQLFNEYGPTEGTVWSSVYHSRYVEQNPVVPIGRSIATTQIYLLNDRLQPVPIGVPGELYITGEGLSRGYHKRPALTAEKFIPNPFSEEPGGRLYKTGDLARHRPDGNIEFIGRIDQQIKLRGYRIELGEIETRLAENSAIEDVVVLAPKGTFGDTQLVAYVISKSTSLDSAALREFLKTRLPEFMLPSVFVFLETFPLTPNGKVDRKALLAFDGGQVTAEYVAPRNPMETLLAEIWSDLLKRERIGIYENFFDMGGHSLLAVQLLHRIQKAIGSELSLMTVFQSPTVASLADVIINALRVPSSPLIALKAEGSRRPLYCIDPTGNHVFAYKPLARSLSVGQPVYGVELHNVFTLSPKATSIAALAKDYAHAILQHQPEGPYQVLGWSLGGVIGLAIVHELEALGQPVAFLGCLDTQTRLGLYETSMPSLLEELAGFLEPESRKELMALPDVERQALQDRLLPLQPEEQVNAMILWAQVQRYFDADVPLEVIKSRYALLKDEALLMNSYRYRPIHAPIHVWWATKTLEREAGIPPIDWTSYTTGLVHTEIIESDHDGILGNPLVHRQIDEILTRLA